jgi:hypothetical protein
MSWYLQIADGAAAPFSSWGLSNLKRHLRSQKAATFAFTADGADADSNPLAAEGTVCIVYYDNIPYFQGRLYHIPRKGSGRAESVEYELRDAWDDFQRNVYQQQWNIIVSVDEHGTPTTAAEYRSECILGMDVSGDALNSGQVISQVVEWAIGVGAHCQLGDIGVSASVPFDEVTDLPCSECIVKMLRWTPDAVAWFDHSTTPPSFNVTRKADCGAAFLEFSGDAEEIAIEALPELVVPSVVIRYLQENKTDGTPSINVIVDDCPSGATGTEFGALVHSCRLAGSNATYQKVPIQTEPMLAIPSGDDDTDSCNWWRNHIGWLHRFSASRLNLDDDSTTGWVLGADGTTAQNDDSGDPVDYDLSDYPNELLRGALADWMNVIHARCTFTTQFTYNYPDTADDESLAAVKIFGGSTDGTSATDDGSQTPITVTATVIGTNAVTQTYSQLSSYDEPEPVPSGLAEQIYDCLATLQYQGQFTTVTEEVGYWQLGTVLNIAGGRAEWAGMNALLQEIVDDLDNGRTSLRFGPAVHLTPQDLMEMLRANRTRTTSRHIKERHSGAPAAPQVNNTTNSPLNDASTAPANDGGYPWIDYIDDQDDETTGLGVTWDGLLGYGASSFAGSDQIDHAGPLEKFELSVGNDGSGWTGPDHNASDLNTALSLISGDDDYTNDRIWIGAQDDDGNGGSILMVPSDPSISLSQNLDPSDDESSDPSITIDLSNLIIDMEDGDGGFIKADLQNDKLWMGDGGGNTAEMNLDDMVIKIADDSGAYCKFDLDGDPIMELYDTDGSLISITTGGDTIISMTGPDGGTCDIKTSDLDGGSASFQNCGTDSDGNTLYVLATNSFFVLTPPPNDGNTYVPTVNGTTTTWVQTTDCS